MVTVDFSAFPVGKGEHVSKQVAKSLDIIDKSKLNYQFGPMGTTIEGSWDEVFKVVKKCFLAMGKDANRAYGTIKIDYQFKDNKGMKARVSRVEKKLGRKLNKA